jgi:hypothetical protein
MIGACGKYDKGAIAPTSLVKKEKNLNKMCHLKNLPVGGKY